MLMPYQYEEVDGPLTLYPVHLSLDIHRPACCPGR